MKQKGHFSRKKVSGFKFLLVLASALLIFLHDQAPASIKKAELKALIVTGQNSHDWKISTSILKSIVENTMLFSVDMAISPSPGEKMDSFCPDFTSYDVVILNYEGDLWSKNTRRDFVAYVRSGGGVVVSHSAGRAFPSWKEYNTIIGLSAGKSRNENHGPYVFFKNGKAVMDHSPGTTGLHSNLHEFTVITREPLHPITKGLPVLWRHAEDQLLGLLRGPAENLTVLATAYSDPVHKGSGRHEPILFTVMHEKGRVFHTVLGHTGKDPSSSATQCAGFIVTFQRGTEWAATGKVTQTIPGDFPAVHTDDPAFTPVRTWPNYRPPFLKDILDELSSYEEGVHDEVILKLRRYVFANRNSENSRRASEKHLAIFLGSEATVTAKMAVCRHLRTLGTKVSVPALEALLLNTNTSDAARYALEKIPGKEAQGALIRSLDSVQDDIKPGIISSLGIRNEVSSAAQLEKYLYSQNQDIALSTAEALAHITSIRSAETLSLSLKKLKGDMRIKAASALLLCTDNLFDAEAPKERLFDLYGMLSAEGIPLPIQQAAIRGKIRTTQTCPIQMVINLLKSKNKRAYLPAIDMIPYVFGIQHIPDLCTILPELPASNQVQLLAVLSRHNIPQTQQSAVLLLDHKDQAIRLAALEALEKIGNEDTADLLARHAALSVGIEQTSARKALWTLRGPDIDQAVLTGLVKTEDPKIKNEFLRAISERQILSGTNLVLGQILSADPINRLQAIRTCREIANPGDLPQLLDLLFLVKSEKEAHELELTIAAISLKISLPERRGNAVIEKLEKIIEPKSRARLIRVLGKMGDNSKLALIRLALHDENEDIRDAAVRALADWPDLSPKYDLLQITQETGNSTHKILALRAYIRMIEMNKFQSPEGAVQNLKTALGLTSRPEEKKLVLGILPVFSCREALVLAGSLLEEDAVKEEAKIAFEMIEKQEKEKRKEI